MKLARCPSEVGFLLGEILVLPGPMPERDDDHNKEVGKE